MKLCNKRLCVPRAVVAWRSGSEYQREQADYDQQADQKYDANSAAQKLQHEDDSFAVGSLNPTEKAWDRSAENAHAGLIAADVRGIAVATQTRSEVLPDQLQTGDEHTQARNTVKPGVVDALVQP